MAVQSPTLSDSYLLFQLESACFDYDQINLRQFKYLLSKAKSLILVDRDPSGISAYILGLFRANSSSVYLYSLAVHPDFRGQGIALRLLSEFEKTVFSRGFQLIKAHTKVTNKAMLTLFEKAGWVKGKVVSGFYSDETDAVELFKKDPR